MKNIKSEKAMLRDIAKLNVERVQHLEETLVSAGHDERFIFPETKEDEIVRDMQGD